MSANVFGFIPESGLLAFKNNAAGGSGYVTLTTPQTITGLKTFDQDAIFNYNLYTANLLASNNISGGAVTAGYIYPTTAIVFPDGSSQLTAYKSLIPGTYTSCQITVDSQGAISAIVSGSSGTIADYVNTYAASGAINYYPCMSNTSITGSPQHMYQQNSFYYSNGDSTLHTDTLQCNTISSITTNATTVNATNLSCNNVNSTLYSPTTLTLSGLNGISMYGNGILGITVNTSGQTLTKQLRVDGDFRLLDVFTPGSGKQSQMYHTNTQLVMYNLENSGSIWIRNKDSTGASAQGILLSYTDCTISSSNCPTINGFTQPSTVDSTSKIATTAWVQSVISTLPAPSNTALYVTMSDNTAAPTSYALCYALGSPDGNKSIYQDYSGLTYVPSTNNLSVGLINGCSFRLDASLNTYAGTTSAAFGVSGAYQNTVYGYGAGQNITSGSNNVCIGYRAGYSDPYNSGPLTGNNNICVGTDSGYSLIGGVNNLLFGHNAGYHLNSQNQNICIGAYAGSSSTLVGNNNVIIGYNAQPALTLENNSVVLGGSSAVNYYFGSVSSVYNFPGTLAGNVGQFTNLTGTTTNATTANLTTANVTTLNATTINNAGGTFTTQNLYAGYAEFTQDDTTGTPALKVRNTVDNTEVWFGPDVLTGVFNPIVVAGQANIIGRQSNASGNKSLILSVWSGTSTGIQINPTNTKIYGNYIQFNGMNRYKTLTIDYATTTFPYTLPTNLPEFVFINANTTATQTIYMPLPTANYEGVRIEFRKAPNLAGTVGSINFTTTSGSQIFCDYNTIGTVTSLGFNTGYVYWTFICDGIYWYLNTVI